jgi:cytidine deaminase
MKELIEKAADVRLRAHAPYSNFLVGAAILGEDGLIYTGCNVENLSFGATICAERSAICAMIASGCKRIRAAAVVSLGGVTPCGMCRQVLIEFWDKALEVPIFCADLEGNVKQFSLRELLPAAFESEALDRNDSARQRSE